MHYRYWQYLVNAKRDQVDVQKSGWGRVNPGFPKLVLAIAC